jgi:hypothetical protein
MNKILTLLLPMCCLLAACPSTLSVSSITACSPSPPANACPAERDKIKILVTPADVFVAPPIVCTNKSGTVTATVTVANKVKDPDKVLVAVVPMNSSDRWMSASRIGPGDMVINVSNSTIVGTQYEYVVMTSTGKCRDPKIHVDQ